MSPKIVKANQNNNQANLGAALEYNQQFFRKKGQTQSKQTDSFFHQKNKQFLNDFMLSILASPCGYYR